MVGRNKRITTKEVVDTVSEGEDIVCLDEPVRPGRKGRAGKNSRLKVLDNTETENKNREKSSEKDENIFAGIDIEGVSEEEKRQIKAALLASTKDQSECVISDTSGDERTCSSVNTSSSRSINEISSEITDKETDKDTELEGNRTLQDQSVCDDDNDETQPPSDTDIEDLSGGLNLDQSTLEESRDDIFETDSTGMKEVDTTLRQQDVMKIEMEDVAASNKNRKFMHSSLPLLNQKTSIQQDFAEDSFDMIKASEKLVKEDSSIELNDTGDSQGPELQSDGRSTTETTVDQSSLVPGQSSRPQRSENIEKLGESDSVEACHSLRSDSEEKNSSEKSPSQRSLDKHSAAPGSSGSQKGDDHTSRSGSQDDKIGSKSVPLKRHYRAVKKEFQDVSREKYFGDTSDIEASAKAIYQLFETYRRKLYEAQRKCREKLQWPEPVKAGQHQSRTIDAKRRGKDSLYLDLSDEDDDVQQDKRIEGGQGRIKNFNSEEENDLDVLPDIKVETNQEPYSRLQLARRSIHTRSADNQIMMEDTQPYDIDDDDDFVPNTRNRSRKQPVVHVNRDSENTRSRTRAGLRNLGSKTENSAKVLVEETQQEAEELQEALRRSQIESQRSLPETQIDDDDFDWLNVKRQNGKEEFENQIHKAKLIGYSIPKHTQMHSKSHQRIIKTEQPNTEELDVMEEEESKPTADREIREQEAKETTENNENVPKFRGRKRKARKQMGVTLVEDTQDLDIEEVNNARVRGKRKRNCFKIDSESEGESIAESQDVNDPSECESSGKESKANDKGAENTNKSKSEGFLSSVVNRMKNFVSASVNKDIVETEEGSQSPVISSKKRLKLSSKPVDKSETEYETEAFNKFKSSSAEKRTKNSTEEEMKSRKRGIKIDFDESQVMEEMDRNNLIEENGIPEGVKRFVNRPSSKDSDNLSITSSQMSTNILDEKGDIYSTQYCEIKSRRGKDSGPRSHQEVNRREEELQEVLMLDSDDEIPVLNVPKKTYNVKKYTRKSQVVKGVTGNKDNQHVSRNECISHYFDKTPRLGDKNVPIDLDPEEDDLENEQTERYGQFDDHDRMEGLSHHSVATAKSRNKETVAKVPFISVLDKEAENVDKVILDKDRGGLQNVSRRMTRGYLATDTIHHLDTGSENPPLMLNNLSKTSDKIEGHFLGARPKTRHVQENTKSYMYEQRAMNRRQRRVSETITSEQYEGKDFGVQTGKSVTHRDHDMSGEERDHDVSGEEWDHVRGSLRKRPGKLDEEGNSPVHVKKKLEMVVCPLCNCEFPSNIIEHHAAECLGPQDEEETVDTMGGEVYMEHLEEEHPHLSQEEILDLHGKYHHSHHHGHRRGLHGHVEHPVDRDEEDVEVSHIIENDICVEDVAKDIRCSPGEEGELQACYICDVLVPKGKQYEVHLNRCLKLAAQQQAVIDKKGYNQVFTESEDKEVQVRTLRGRQINPVNRDGTPRTTRHQPGNSLAYQRNSNTSSDPESSASSTSGHSKHNRNLKSASKSESPRSGLDQNENFTVGLQQYDQGDHGIEEGAAKRMLKRGNRNKAAVNDDGTRRNARS